MKTFRELVLRVGLTLILHSFKKVSVGYQGKAVKKRTFKVGTYSLVSSWNDIFLQDIICSVEVPFRE